MSLQNKKTSKNLLKETVFISIFISFFYDMEQY